MSGTDTGLVTTGLTKDYGGGRGIVDLDLRVDAGEVFGFIGPNGAGKSTTIRLLMDFIRPDRGDATLLGLDSRRDSVAIKRRTGFVPGELAEYGGQRAWRIVQLHANLRGGVDPGRIESLTTRLELDLGRRYREYSHGNKQKLALLLAFMHEPDLLILDEPTLGLDPLVQAEFRALIAEAAARGATVFLSSHVLSEVQEICRRIGLVSAGRLLRAGTMGELRDVQVHRVDVRVDGSVSAAVLTGVPGVSDVEVTDHHVTLRMQGAFGPLLAALQPAGIVELDSEELSLEEVFLAALGKPQPPL